MNRFISPLLSLTLGCTLLLAGCGGSSSPTSPSAPAAGTTRIIAVSGSLAFGDVLVGSTGDQTLTVSNTGTGTLTISGVTAPASISALLSATISGTGAIPPGGNTTVRIRFAPTAAGQISGTVSITGDQTGGTNTMAMTGNGTVPTFTVVGVVRDATSNAPLSGVSVRIVAGTGLNQTGSTDGNGYYSIPGVAGPITVSFSLSGYDSVSRPTVANADTRFDTTLTRSGPVAAALEYRVTGSRGSLTYSNCTGGTSQVGAANLPWSFTCASVPAGQFVYISAQNTGDSGTISVAIYKRGVLYRESSSTGAFVIATASGSY